jgi:hypothetical protein
MAAIPPRRPDPLPHLLAHLVPLERALRHRAAEMEQEAAELLAKGGYPEAGGDLAAAIGRYVAGEFRTLAAELHHWD